MICNCFAAPRLSFLGLGALRHVFTTFGNRGRELDVNRYTDFL